jgi:hypothetical protein
MKDTKITFNALVDLFSNGRINIQSDEFTTPQFKPFLDLLSKKVRGRVAMDANKNICFEPYHEGLKQPTVMQKEQVGMVNVRRTKKKVEFSLSLPIEMSQSIMCLTLMQQCSLVTDALGNGLYDRMVGGQESATTTPSTTTSFTTTSTSEKNIAA